MRFTLSALALSLAATPLVSRGQGVAVFNDTFSSGSTLNGTSTPGGTTASSSTSYDVASTKTGSCTLTAGSPGYLREKLSSATTGGYVELQALFTSTPYQLVNVGDSINITMTFTNSAGTLLLGGNKSTINVGLYYSGGLAPVAGTLNAAGLNTTSTTYATGNCQDWQGYVASINCPTFSSTINTRPWQSAGGNSDQDLMFSGAGSGLYKNPAGTQIGSSVTSAVTLSTGTKYTVSCTITLTALGTTANLNTVAITNSLYDANGNLLSNQGGTTSGGNTYTNYANYYDGFAIGIANSGTSYNPTMDISRITISTNYYFAPTIATMANQTVVAGKNLTLSPTLVANPQTVVQWYVSTDGGVTSNALAYATAASLTLTNVQYSQNNYIYTLVVGNLLGTNASSMELSVIVTPGIAGLVNQAALVGTNVTISPTVTGVPAPACQWQTTNSASQMVNLTDGTNSDGSGFSGSQTSSLTITNVQMGEGATYWLVATNVAGLVTNSMTLTVSPGNSLPVITGPTNVTAIQNNNAAFSASAAGVPNPTLQWLDQTATPIPNATNSTLTLTAVQYSQNGYVYSVVANNSVGSVTNSATLTVEVPPTITAQPASLVVTNTQAASFTVGAWGAPAVAYQWFQGTNAISLAANSTASNPTLAFAAASPTNIGSYYVVITNLVGVVTSSVVSLTVNSTTITPTGTSPTSGATGICYDTPLSITFNQAPSLGKTGQIRIYNVTNGATPVEIIDLSSNNASGVQTRAVFPGDSSSFNYYPVVINGNTANIYPHSGDLMTSNQTYYVTIGEGVFTDSTGAYFPGITATNYWQFTTKPGGPVDPVNPVVNANGTADFVTVQGALDSLAANARGLLRTISIAPGFYFEIVDDSGKTNVTLRGQSRTGSVIFYPNNAVIAVGGSTHDRMSFKVNANDVALDNLTISNSTPQGGSQAEALMVESSAKRCIVNNCEIASRQDTILANVNSSQAFFYNSTIDGNYDYVWGGGNLFFLKCTLHTISGETAGNLTAARTDTASAASTNTPWVNPNGTTYSANGMSFVNCQMIADPGIATTTLADANGTAGGLASWAFCQIDSNVYIPPAGALSNSYVFWQFQNTDTNGVNPVTFTNVQFIGVTNNDPRLLAVTNITTWFYGWTPALLPNITSQPVGATVTAGQGANFSVGATGIPDPAYQWLFNGAPIAGATSATYPITSAARTNGGNYAVVVSNASGSVTSAVAVLTYSNTPPVAAPVSYTRNASVYQLNISTANLLTYVTDADSDPISLVSVSTSTNGITPTISGNYIVYDNPSAVNDQFSYTVTDGYGGTSTAVITVNVNTQALFGQSSPGISTSGGSAVMNFAGIPGYSYSVQRSTDVTFSSFQVVLTTNAPSGGVFQFIDSNPPVPTAFYRLQYNHP